MLVQRPLQFRIYTRGEEGEGEARFSFAFVRGEVWRGFERSREKERERESRKVECNSFRGGNKGMGKSEEWVEAHRVPCACHGFTSL